MNYVIAFLICIACTIMAALEGNEDTYWLAVSDANVAIFLSLAWLLDRRRR